MKIGDIVGHHLYGKDEIISMNNESKLILVAFDKEHEIPVQIAIDEPYFLKITLE